MSRAYVAGARAPRLAALLSTGTLVSLGACRTSPTDSCATPSVAVGGTWRYDAVQDVPSRATLSGTLALSGGSCSTFTGTLDVVEINAQGQSRHLAGPVSGSVLGASSVRLDAALDAGTRQHIGTVAPDSLFGSWLESSGPNGNASGSFRARRGATP